MDREESKNPHKGHRQKVRQSYYENGLRGMPDHNVLEMLLFFGIPYKDTNEIAHRLMDKFGSFSGVLHADVSALMSVKGMTENAACLLNVLLPVFARYSEDINSKKPQLTETKEIVRFISPKFVGALNERVYILCFDKNHTFINSRLVNEGDSASVFVNFRTIASAVLETKATSAVLVHNHPNTIALPSPNDLAATSQVYDFLKTMNVALYDHIIIAGNKFCSMAQTPRFSHIFFDGEAVADCESPI